MSHWIKGGMKAAIAVAVAASGAAAQAYSFSCVAGDVTPGSNAVGCTTAGTSLASWSLLGNVLTIQNASGAGNGSVITGISFDGSLGDTVALSATQGTGVLYTTGGGAHLPASLNWTVDFNFQPDRKPTTNGINAGESLAFNLGGVSLADIQNGSFKFGLHIQALPGGRSEKLVTTAVPEPESYAMALAGLAVVGGVAVRRRVRG
ncbi:PEP-CTERM sorting domain-containing protein [Aquabacterium sp.]|uniref:PEP-CTERM sorting domain-containing protein n=1 Tax=Aquabacterium sp. TaxID=1872578 RepID=UPI0025C27556|nr:PEP-CTERM sorting domain-containing protein [Aquabacterium sp.]